MATNYLGTFCMNPAIPESKKGEKPKKEESEEKCTYNVYHQFSLANKIDRPEFLEVQDYLNLITAIVLMVMLIFFRKS